jgi:hypothetical protein
MIYKFTSPDPTEGELKLAEAWKHLYEVSKEVGIPIIIRMFNGEDRLGCIAHQGHVFITDRDVDPEVLIEFEAEDLTLLLPLFGHAIVRALTTHRDTTNDQEEDPQDL